MVFVRSFSNSVILAILVFTSTAVKACLVQKPDLILPPDAATRREEVREMFTKSYKAYQYVSLVKDGIVD
jgi:hypothetical protein